jgi:hypothetical protein
VDGFFAVLLWHDYVRNANLRALETLLAYNIQDVVTLETLMVLAYNRKLAGTPFLDRYLLDGPRAPAVPFVPHTATIARIKREYGWR